MKENKKLWRKFRYGKAAGFFVPALIFVFALAACGGGGDDGGAGGGGGSGGSLGTSALGETLIIEGVQVYNSGTYGRTSFLGRDEDYKKYTGGNIEFEVENSNFYDSYTGNIGGKVIISGGKLDFTANPVRESDLHNVKADSDNDHDSLAYKLNDMVMLNVDLEYKNLLISGTDWENAKFAVLRSFLGRNEGGRTDSLSRYRNVLYNDPSHDYDSVSTVEEAAYIYVDKTITVTSDGDTKTTSGSGGDDHYVLKALNITLEKGWNVLYSKFTGLGATDTDTFEIKTGDPSSVYWLNQWDN